MARSVSSFPTISATSRVVLLWAGTRIDIDRGLLAFRSRQVTNANPQHPIGDDPQVTVTYEGWSLQIAVERFNNQIDRLFYDIEQAYATGGGSPWTVQGPFVTVTDPVTGVTTQTRTVSTMPGKVYQYVREPDGSETTLEFAGVSGSLSDAGSYEIGRPVVQVLDLFASRRQII